MSLTIDYLSLHSQRLLISPLTLRCKTVPRRIKKFTKALAPQTLTSHLQHILICPTYLLLFPTENNSYQNYTPCDIHIWHTLLFHLGFPLTVLERVIFLLFPYILHNSTFGNNYLSCQQLVPQLSHMWSIENTKQISDWPNKMEKLFLKIPQNQKSQNLSPGGLIL